MAKNYSDAEICGGEDRTSIVFGGAEQDYGQIYRDIMAVPDSRRKYATRVFTEAERWIIWLTYKAKPQRALAKALKTTPEKIKEVYEGLSKQGGPKGEKPKWMK